MLGQSLPFPLLAFISFVSGLCVLERRTTIAAHYLPWNAKTFGDYSIFTGFWYGSRGAFIV
jgi:hypothetical protein